MRPGTLTRDAVSLAVVVISAAGVLRAADVVPQIIGEPRGGRPFACIADVERRLGERVAVPAYFPETLRWPPTRIRVGGTRPAVVVLALGERAIFGQTIGSARPIPQRLWPGGVILDSERIDLGAAGGTLDRILGEDGRVWHEVRWDRWDRRFALRSLASAQDVVQMARIVRRQP
jgi:hypothetical protein